MESVLSNTVAAVAPLPALHVKTHIRGEHTTAGAAEDGESIRDLVIWFQREYERANSQILGERDAWGAEMHRGAGGEPSDRLETAKGWELGQCGGGSLVDGERDGD
ncbi:C6 zinc finger domain containing protein [Lasiodiplodia theobromae]|uniref:C6 zinc finger domain containing protein n=1 Tax=Lasiodiplodia theobromae TaxID=45133 RepID=UPI0015C3415A|nr:C6 zinc finger domain containing protein [Lasiodiplodia theobromae]KAF4537464.1 C6 zinc finger domain containing protein [Lasiodiplodia theobromae]